MRLQIANNSNFPCVPLQGTLATAEMSSRDLVCPFRASIEKWWQAKWTGLYMSYVDIQGSFLSNKKTILKKTCSLKLIFHSKLLTALFYNVPGSDTDLQWAPDANQEDIQGAQTCGKAKWPICHVNKREMHFCTVIQTQKCYGHPPWPMPLPSTKLSENCVFCFSRKPRWQTDKQTEPKPEPRSTARPKSEGILRPSAFHQLTSIRCWRVSSYKWKGCYYQQEAAWQLNPLTPLSRLGRLDWLTPSV